jgi:hypothetical protein
VASLVQTHSKLRTRTIRERQWNDSRTADHQMCALDCIEGDDEQRDCIEKTKDDASLLKRRFMVTFKLVRLEKYSR